MINFHAIINPKTILVVMIKRI
jgi:hypothetical protein